MAEHLIRLRGGWLWQELDSPATCPIQTTLPAYFDSRDGVRVRLSRRFGRPSLDHQTETLWLRLQNVPGLVSIMINGSPIPLHQDDTQPLEIAMKDLPDRNLLVLEMSNPEADAARQAAAHAWGEIALVVRPVTH